MYESGHTDSPSRDELRAALRRLDDVLLGHARQLPPVHPDRKADLLLQVLRRTMGLMQQELARLRLMLASGG